jgi:hypothetical protein
VSQVASSVTLVTVSVPVPSFVAVSVAFVCPAARSSRGGVTCNEAAGVAPHWVWAACTAMSASTSPCPKMSSRPAVPRSTVIAPLEMIPSSCAGVSVGQTAFMRATTPATWGEAIEVPW